MSDDLDRLSQQISQLREEKSALPLELADLDPDPFVQFGRWLDEALDTHRGWPNAMTLATVDADGKPSARTVLLKGVDRDGFTFYTNYSSRKGRELVENPHAAVVFYWPLLGRQVCVRGEVERVPADESDDYFATRPRSSQLGAWASNQSEEISDRSVLQRAAEAAARRFGDEIPRPEQWGGFRLVPVAFEFWKSRPDRLHDRFGYEPDEQGWRIARLAP